MDEWIVAVFKCRPEDVKNTLIELHRFIKDLAGTKSQHFMIRDRLEDEVVFSFRILPSQGEEEKVKSKVRYKLGTLFSKGQFSINPRPSNPLHRYMVWSAQSRITKTGYDKYLRFYTLLEKISEIVIEMYESN